MARKSDQIQIRVTPTEKAALKERARAAGQDVSTYVLARALPRDVDRFRSLVAALVDEADGRFALAELNEFLALLPAGRFHEVVGEAEAGALAPFTRNYLAAMVERAAQLKGLQPPRWTRGVDPLDRPWFATPLPGLRLHLLRVSPVPFKRRNLFVDSSVGDRV